MNILHIIGSLNIGGVQKYLLELSKSAQLNSYKHEVLSTYISNNNYLEIYERNKISIKILPFNRLPNIKIPYKIDKFLRNISSNFFIFRLWYYLLFSDVNIVHTHIHSHIISQILAAIFSRKKIVWTIHGEYSIGSFKLLFIRILNLFTTSNQFYIIADSQAALFNSLPYFKKLDINKNIIPTGIDLKPFLDLRKTNILKKRYKLENSTIIIGSVGRIVWQKGYDQILKVLQSYNFRDLKIHFLIAGDGSLRNSMIDRIKEKKLEKNISFIGNINNIPEFLSGLDIYIQPSISEGYPLAVIEAMVAGIPIISSDAGGLKEMVINKKNGLVYKHGNIKDLFDVLNKTVLMSEKSLSKLADNAKKHVMKNNSIEKVASQYKKVYLSQQ